MRTRTALLAASTAGAMAAGPAGGLRATARRWSAAADPTAGAALCLPEGTEERIRTPDGAELAATVAGDGDQLFLLAHGWTQDRRVWGFVARDLVARGHRVVLYDHRGHGESTTGSDGFSLEALAADMGAVLAHVDARQAVVAGHSMGGMTAQAFAVGHPDLFDRHAKALVLVSTACDGLGRGGAADRVARRAIASPLVDRLTSHPTVGPLLVRGSVGRFPAMPHLHAARSTLATTDPAARVGFLAAMQEMDFGEALRRLDVPVSILCGSHDRLTPPARSRRLAEVVPGAELVVIPDAGHMLPWEAPDRVTDLLEAAAAASTTADAESLTVPA